MQDLDISLVQFNPVWENKEENIRRLDIILKDIKTDLIVLPEMFSTGFSMNARQIAEPMSGSTVVWMLELAVEKGCCVCGSIVITENGKYFNRLIWVNAFGVIKYYDKRHLFRMGDENLTYTAGNSRKIMLCNGWRICPLICYDLRFPVWSRNKVKFDSYDYDLLIYVACWPKKRAIHWKQLLISRAIENQAYVLGVNRVGTDGNDVEYLGDSTIINHLGETMTSNSGDEAILKATLSKQNLRFYRKSFPVWRDVDNFEFIPRN